MWILVPLALSVSSGVIGWIVGVHMQASKIEVIARDKEAWDDLRDRILSARFQAEMQKRIMKELHH